MSTITINGKSLPGEVDTAGWNIDGSSRYNILTRQHQQGGYTVSQTALDFSPTEPASVGIVIRTFICDEISTEETIQKLVAYCFQYLDTIGKLVVGSKVISNYAVLHKITPWLDHKKGYGLAYHFTAIDKSGGLRWVEPLKNPSFDAYDNANGIEYWEQIKEDTGCINEQAQLFGNEPLGDGQYCVKTKSLGSSKRARLQQDLTFVSGASASDIENLYLKFSVDCAWEENTTVQSYGNVFLAFVKPNGAYHSSQTLKLYNNRPTRLSIMCSYAGFYTFNNIKKIDLVNLTTNGVIYFDRARIEEVEL